jgi:hypothetical protein
MVFQLGAGDRKGGLYKLFSEGAGQPTYANCRYCKTALSKLIVTIKNLQYEKGNSKNLD